jgi:hypothetical protein
MNRFLLVLLFSIFSSYFLLAQKEVAFVSGKVMEITEDSTENPLIGVNVYWAGTQNGVTTDAEGNFTIGTTVESDKLVFSYVGYQSDTFIITDSRFIRIILQNHREIDAATIVHRQRSLHISAIDPIKTEKIGEKELLKAACCNLSESFETNPSVDVTFTDAITGTKQIQMLGLAGPYTQITRENMPDVRGLSAIYGLTYIPGPWISGIMLNKGAGSVVNGFESIAGQIDVQLRKPETMDRLYFNAYVNEDSRLEGNLMLKAHVNEKLGTGLFLHASNSSMRNDKNKDGFMDMPLTEQYIALNRWEFHNELGVHLEFALKGLYFDNTSGQMNFKPESDKGSLEIWGMNNKTRRIEGWAKAGKANPDKPWQSFGLQISGAYHQQDAYFGLNTFDGLQQSMYTNFIYQGILGNTAHKFRTGASYQYDNVSEWFNNIEYSRIESVPGIFYEYTYSYLEKFNAVAGIRADYHNLYGLFFTPRLHLRYAVTPKSIIRASAGRGQRTSSVLSENIALLASSRQIIFVREKPSNPYGLNPEIAWNFGLNFTQHFIIDYRQGTFTADLYHTRFTGQVVIDLEQSPQQALIYDLEGKSFSNSMQLQFDYELIKRLDIRLAYRFYDVRTTYSGALRKKPLVSKHRSFVNAAYETRNHWKFDATFNWQGPKRIPNTESNPEEFQLPPESPGFGIVNFHISKTWREKFEIYAGVENAFNFKQKHPIIAAEQPFGPYFDSSLVWGPVFGRNIYVGLRLRIK